MEERFKDLPAPISIFIFGFNLVKYHIASSIAFIQTKKVLEIRLLAFWLRFVREMEKQ